MTRRPLGLAAAVLVASALGCTSVAPPSPSASATPTGEHSATTTPTPDGGPEGRLPKGGPRDRPAVPAAPELRDAYHFVSAPDFLNQDVADLTADGREEYVDPRTGAVANSTNKEYDAGLRHVLDEMASYGTRDVLVAGDLVEGRWGRDDSGSGVFGPVRTEKQRMRAWRRAAAVYYPAYRQRFADHGLRTFPAVGDHEIGDDPWKARRDPWIAFKRSHVPQFKQIFADEMLTTASGRSRFSKHPSKGPARRTAYAVRLDADVLLVTLDVFERRGGDVHMSVDPAQLRWLERVLRKARRDEVPWVMVQGHVPMTGDVRARNSSHLTYEKGDRSALWKAMVDGGVDVYLSGEVHDQTVHQVDGILQVSHGSLFYRGEASYVVGQATADELVLENHQFRGEIGFEDRLWTTSRQGAPGHISYPDPSLVTGTLEAHRTRSGGVKVDAAAGVLKPRR
ncbi:metallophosphoesterase [Nocardioides KLBMP 9356]|uniref:Metallophosphoesterase n=1 Tax=Nocardioides potassii TaxID=2911371 RepID=A0ABS9HAM7_9ACTN|nr:metallophosphoesterase [Nocardioides potassii]MCF6377300.1 metallophosphoesterase [Nocardioides potassii]